MPTYNSDATLEADLQTLKDLGFNTIISYEPLFIEDPSIICLVLSRTHKLAALCDTYGMKLMPCVWGTEEPVKWIDRDLDNATFKDWLTRHLARVQIIFGEHPSFAGLVWDDFALEEGKIDNWTSWVSFVESHTIGLNVFDDVLETFSDRVVPSERLRVSEYYYFWQYRDVSIWPRYVKDGIVLDCFDPGWNPYYLSQDLGNYSGDFVSCYAWRRGNPETNTTLCWNPNYWNSIRFAFRGTQSSGQSSARLK